MENTHKQTKLERKRQYQEYKNTMKLNHFKKYTIQNRNIVMHTPMRVQPNTLGISYDEPEDGMRIFVVDDLNQKPAWIATNLDPEKEEILIATLKEYQDVFAWSYKDMSIGKYTNRSYQ